MPAMRKHLCALLAVSAIVTAVVSTSPTVAVAIASQPADPLIGPHLRDEARHIRDQLHFSPASGPILPRRSRAASASAPGAAPGAAPASVGNLTREVFAFAPYWALSANAQTGWRYNLLSTLAYFGISVNGDGSFNTADSAWAGWNSQNLVDMINRAHTAGDRVVVVIKATSTATANTIVTSETSRQAAIANTINAIAAKTLDGVNVDLEGSSTGIAGAQAGFTTFMSELSTQVHQRWPNAMVTADTYSGAASWDGGFFNISALEPHVDAFFIMAYDMSFSNLPGQAGPNAPLNGWTYNDSLSVSQYLSKAPASKIILGVPYYGYAWSVGSNPGARPAAYATATGGASSLGYADIGTCFASGPISAVGYWDTTAQSPWAIWWSPSTNDPCQGNHGAWRELYYDDATSLGIKYDLVNANNLRGTGMWALGYDGNAPELWSVLSVKFAAPWQYLGGQLSAGPAATTFGINRIDVFARGQDNHLWHQVFNGTTWSGWETLGGTITADPAAVSWGNNRIDVMARGQDNQLWHKWFDGTIWSGWQPLGGGLASAPAVSSWAPNRLDVFIQGQDKALWHKWFDGTGWSGWQTMGGVITAAPGAVSWGSNRVDVFARGQDNQLWHKWFDSTGWSGWQPNGGTLASGPGVTSWGPNRLDIFVAGQDGQLWHVWWDGTRWNRWQALGGVVAGDPAATAPAVGQIDVFVEGGDHALWHKSLVFY
jgi:spore germination protein YaaH